ncbi:MAG: anti-sigma factor [Pyrinomonadaceae bacterium]
MSGHEEYKEMLEANALGALDEAEARSLAKHLATCEECRAEAEEWSGVASALAYTSAPVEPSVELRARLLDRVRSEAQPAVTNDSNLNVRSESNLNVRSENSSSKVLPFAPPAPRVRSGFNSWGAIAASIIIAALIISLLYLLNSNRALQAEIAQLKGQPRETEEQAEYDRLARALLTTPDARMVSLSGTPAAPRALAHIVYNMKTGEAMLYANGLPPAPTGKAYQLWFIKDGKPMPGKVFNPDAKGTAEMKDQMPVEARNSNLFAVTLEPQQGVTAPTGDKYLLGPA